MIGYTILFELYRYSTQGWRIFFGTHTQVANNIRSSFARRNPEITSAIFAIIPVTSQRRLQLPGWPALAYDRDDHGIVTRCPAKERNFSSGKCWCLSWGSSMILWNVWSGCYQVDKAAGGVVSIPYPHLTPTSSMPPANFAQSHTS